MTDVAIDYNNRLNEAVLSAGGIFSINDTNYESTIIIIQRT